jgi:hypothetical protein
MEARPADGDLIMARAELILSLTTADQSVQDGLVAWAADMKVEIGEAIRRQMRLLVTDLLKLTPPFGSRGARNESFGFQRKIGEQAVTRDIRRVFVSIEEIAARNTKLGAGIQSALEKNNMAVLGKGNSLPELLVKAKVADTPDHALARIIELPSDAQHNQFRDSRGRVKKRIPFPFLVKRTAALKQYIKFDLHLVGELKGGWGVAAKRFGASAPVWISRHFSGEVVDQTNATDNPFAIARNTVSYIGANNADIRITTNALQDRAVSMERQIAGHAARLKKV